MKLPNKLFSYSESIVSEFSIILYALVQEDLTIYELYIKTINKFKSITEFIEVLDCLFLLGKIEYNQQTRRIRNAV